jgi:signal transduction histidine kinase/ActR/RegA family two-component response regulator
MTDEVSEESVEGVKLRETAEPRLFLLRFSDRLRALDDPIVIQQTACTLLGEHLGANRVMFAEVVNDEFMPGPTYVHGVAPLPAVRTPIGAFGEEVLEACRRGDLLYCEDVEQDPRVSPQQLERYRSIQVASHIAVMLIRRERLVGVFAVHFAAPQRFTVARREIVREVADRIWEAVERARAEAALRLSEEQLRHALTLRDEFLAVLSHELRTPLSAILIWAKMLRAGAVKPEEQAQALAVIEQSALAQRTLIEDLLDVSGMISGKVRMHMETGEIGGVLAATVEAVHPMADAKRVALTLDLLPAPVFARIDRSRLQQVVWNLVYNAVKFTPAGGSVRVRLQHADDAIRIEVADTGRGIAAAFLPFVFERFRQADSGTTRTYGGLGLGLAIARQLVELHGGTIEAKSDGEGRGATFVVELPPSERDVAATGRRASHAHPIAESEPFVPSPSLHGVRVLFVEDEAHTRTVVQWLLEQCGAVVTPVASAAAALAALIAGPSDGASEVDGSAEHAVTAPGAAPAGKFDLLVSDVGLPEKDGYELLAEVRRSAEGHRLRALALTAYAREEDRLRALEAGFEAYLAKPVEPRALVETIADILRR